MESHIAEAIRKRDLQNSATNDEENNIEESFPRVHSNYNEEEDEVIMVMNLRNTLATPVILQNAVAPPPVLEANANNPTTPLTTPIVRRSARLASRPQVRNNINFIKALPKISQP